MASVTVSNVCKSFGKFEVLHGIDLTIADGEFVVLLGPSGCGKSTLLRMIAGLEPITSGQVSIGNVVVNDLHPKDRNIAMVFQNYALYAHLSVFDNMAFSMQLKKLPKDEIRRKVEWAASILDLKPYLDRLPKQLSGGQRQRVAMGRAIVRDPSVFLFDEPLSNLDAKLRVQMRT
jgi:multiple sugar transport system ATP-binding protein